MTQILVIEDDDLVRNMISNTLRKAGFEVALAANGKEGLEQAEALRPELVVTDILMPDKEGIETILELKAIDKHIKIIAMSGGGSAKNMTFLDMAQKVGAHKVMTKPFKSSELLETIKVLLAS